MGRGPYRVQLQPPLRPVLTHLPRLAWFFPVVQIPTSQELNSFIPESEEARVFGRKDNDSAWKSRFPELATCVRCLEEKDVEEMDRLLWCQSCRELARKRAGVWGWATGAVLAAALAVWIWTVIQPSDLIISGWVATVVVTLWIGSRVAREIAYGVLRFTNRKAAEAVPPKGEE